MDRPNKYILSKEYQIQRRLILERKKIVRQAEKFADKVEKMLGMKAPSK
jgi:hypothetical protein